MPSIFDDQQAIGRFNKIFGIEENVDQPIPEEKVGEVAEVNVNVPAPTIDLQEPEKTEVGTGMMRQATEGNPLIEMAIAKKKAEQQAEAQPEQVQVEQPTPDQPVIENKPIEQQMAETGRQSELDQMNAQATQPTPQQPIPVTLEQEMQTGDQLGEVKAGDQMPTQNKVFGGEITVTARGNQYYPGSRKVNAGTDFAGEAGTKVSLPQGEWEVVESVNNVTKRTPGNFTKNSNYGWGNSVKVRNKETGEIIRYSHMQAGSVPDLKSGQTIKGGSVVGAIGNTGNTVGKTGNHLDVEYYDNRGRRRDVLTSPYKNQFLGG